MVSRERKKEVGLHEKLQLLRSITNSHAVNDTSIIADASKYIEALKDKVDRLNQEITSSCSFGQTSSSSSNYNTMNAHDDDSSHQHPAVTVETLDKGILVNVFAEKSCPGLLVSVLEAFEELNLTVVEARVSCTDSFRFEAVGGDNEEQGENIDSEVVRQAVLQAIKQWNEVNGDQQD